MCEYSAMGLPNRLATESETLISKRCGKHDVVCFVNATDQSNWDTWKQVTSTTIGKIMNAIRPSPEPDVPLVCVPPGARLRLSGIPENIQRLAGIKTSECEVALYQLPPQPNTFLDGVIFLPTGKLVSMQDMGENVTARVLSLDGTTKRKQAEERMHAYTYAR